MTVASTTDILACPGEDSYAVAIDGYNLRSNLAPAFAAVATTTEDVVVVLDTARRRGLGVRVRSTGHGFNSRAPLGEEVVLRTLFTAPVTVDPAAKTAVVPAGALWGDVVAAAADFGLAALHGSAASVGVIGYLLEGGASFYGRKFGLASNLIRSITVVLSDSRIVTADAETNPELFWALRGGGGGFGVVTSVTIDLIDVPSVATGAVFWPIAVAPAILEAWEKWAPTAPREISTALRVMSLPPQPGIPPQLTNGPVVVIDGAALDRDAETGTELIDALLSPLREGYEPLLDTWHHGPASDVLGTHMDPPTPSPFFGDHIPLDALGAVGRAAFLSIAGQPAGANLSIIELRQLGGAFAEPNPAGGVVDRLEARFGCFSVGILLGGNAEEVVVAQLDALRTVLQPWTSEFTVPSFVERFGAPQKSFGPAKASRVEAIRRRSDPTGTFAGDVTTATA